MTRISYWPEEFRLRAEGHAGAGERGEDLVCAAVTTLCCTLACAAEEVPEYRLQMQEIPALTALEFRCCPEEEKEASCREMFRTIAAGFAGLAEEYPAFVCMEERGEEA